MLFTTLPIGYIDNDGVKYLKIEKTAQMVWLLKENAECYAIDSALDVWGVMANWETDTFDISREEYPACLARGLRSGALLVKLEGTVN